MHVLWCRYLFVLAVLLATVPAASSQSPLPPGPDEPTRWLLYLPTVLTSGSADLVVKELLLVPNKTAFRAGEPVTFSIVIENRGIVAARPFWVDLYFNPARTPQLNLTWNTICSIQPCLGLAWRVNRNLAVGEAITLTSTADSYAAGQSFWPGWMASGTTDVYVLADSWNPGKNEGLVGEENKSNNLLRFRGLEVTGVNPPLASPSAGTSPRN